MAGYYAHIFHGWAGLQQAMSVCDPGHLAILGSRAQVSSLQDKINQLSARLIMHVTALRARFEHWRAIHRLESGSRTGGRQGSV
jgi:hypothetical protein